MNRITVKLIVLTLGFAFASCESDNKKVEHENEELSYYYLLATISYDVEGSCLAAKQQAFSCATTAGGAAYGEALVSSHEQAYTITVSAPRQAAELCTSLLGSSNFPVPGDTTHTYTAGAKICFLDCEKSYWERAISGGRCTAGGFSTLIPGNDATYKECTENCLVRGSILL